MSAALSVAIGVSLTACAPGGGGTNSGSDAAEDTDESCDEGIEGEATVTWWDYAEPGPVEEAYTTQIEAYEEDNPNVTVDRRFVAYDDIKKSLLQSAGADALPDVVIINGPDHQQFAELGIAADLTDLLEEWGELDKYPDGLIASATWEDRIYGLPATADDLALFYDKDLFEEKGLTPPTTWEELRSTAEELTQDDRYGFIYAAPPDQSAVFQWLPTLWQAGGDLTDLDSPEAVEALEYWSGLVEDGLVSRQVLNWRQGDITSEFAQGRAAMMLNGPWAQPTIEEEAPDLNWGVALLPKNVEEASVTGGENYLVIDGPNRCAAWDLVRWLQEPERAEYLATTMGTLPTRTDIPVPETEAMQVFVEQLQVARPRAYGPNYPQIADAVVEAIQGTISGSTTAEEALNEAAEKVEPLLPEDSDTR